MRRYADAKDLEICRKIHKQYGTTYYYSTLRMAEKYRRRVHSLYAFVRVADEWVDNAQNEAPECRLAKLKAWREAMVAGVNGVRPEHPAMRAFCDTLLECRIPMEEPHVFLDAMEMDVAVTRYPTYEDLRRYMRGSASAIGVMMCYVTCARTDYDTIARAKALGEAMQLTNFLRDVGEDLERGRIYLPLEDLQRFGLTEQDILSRRVTPAFKELMRYECERARRLYAYSDFGILKLPNRSRRAVLLARVLYSQILDRIEANDFDVFTKRARTSKLQKLAAAIQIGLGERAYLQGLLGSSGNIPSEFEPER